MTVVVNGRTTTEGHETRGDVWLKKNKKKIRATLCLQSSFLTVFSRDVDETTMWRCRFLVEQKSYPDPNVPSLCPALHPSSIRSSNMTAPCRSCCCFSLIKNPPLLFCSLLDELEALGLVVGQTGLEKNGVHSELGVQQRHVAVDFDEEVDALVSLVEMGVVVWQGLRAAGTTKGPTRRHLKEGQTLGDFMALCRSSVGPWIVITRHKR